MRDAAGGSERRKTSAVPGGPSLRRGRPAHHGRPQVWVVVSLAVAVLSACAATGPAAETHGTASTAKAGTVSPKAPRTTVAHRGHIDHGPGPTGRHYLVAGHRARPGDGGHLLADVQPPAHPRYDHVRALRSPGGGHPGGRRPPGRGGSGPTGQRVRELLQPARLHLAQLQRGPGPLGPLRHHLPSEDHHRGRSDLGHHDPQPDQRLLPDVPGLRRGHIGCSGCGRRRTGLQPGLERVGTAGGRPDRPRPGLVPGGGGPHRVAHRLRPDLPAHRERGDGRPRRDRAPWRPRPSGGSRWRWS